MSKYELAAVVSAKLEDEERIAVIDKIKDQIARFNGTVIDVDDRGKKQLAYEIQKEGEAFYYFIHFETEDSNCPNELEAQLRIMDNLLRYLCVKEEDA